MKERTISIVDLEPPRKARLQCEAPAEFMASLRQCRKLAKWKVGKLHVCGTHRNVLVTRAVLQGSKR